MLLRPWMAPEASPWVREIGSHGPLQHRELRLAPSQPTTLPVASAVAGLSLYQHSQVSMHIQG